MTNQKLWTEQEWAEAQQMRREGRSYRIIAELLGRSGKSVQDKFARESGRRERETVRVSAARPTDEMLEQVNRKYEALARRNLTASLMGDPPPGFSALEQRAS